MICSTHAKQLSNFLLQIGTVSLRTGWLASSDRWKHPYYCVVQENNYALLHSSSTPSPMQGIFLRPPYPCRNCNFASCISLNVLAFETHCPHFGDGGGLWIFSGTTHCFMNLVRIGSDYKIPIKVSNLYLVLTSSTTVQNTIVMCL